MAIIYSYPSTTPVVADILVITQASDRATKSVTLSSVKTLFGLNDSLNGVGTPGYIPFFETDSRLVDSFISQDGNGLVFIGSQASGTRFTNTSVSSTTLLGTDLYAANIYGQNGGLLNIQGNTTFGGDIEVQGSIYATPIIYSSSQDAYALRMGANNNTAFDMGIKIKSTPGGVPYMSLRSHNTEDLLVLRSTNVGIGLTAGQEPKDKLHVLGTVRAVATSPNDYAFIGLNTSGSDALGLRYANGSGEVELKDNLGVRRVRLSCDPDDYTYFNGAKGVGVGRDVSGDAKFEVNTALSGEVGAKIISTDGVGLEVETIAANNADIQRWKIGNTIKAVVDSEGKFGIGRSDAAAELDVLGKIRAVAKDTSGFSISSLNSNFTAASGLFFNTDSASLILKNDENVENVKINSDGDSFLKGGRLGVGADLATARSLTKVFVEGGDIQIDQGSAAAATGIVLQTPDGSARYKITIDNNGNIVSTQV